MSVLNKDFVELIADGSTIFHNVPLSKSYLFYALGDFDSGVIHLESSIDNGANYYNLAVLSDSGRVPVRLTSAEKIRVTLSGSNGAASVFSGVRE